MKAISTSDGRMSYRQKASWKCEPQDGFIYLLNNDIDLSGYSEPEYLGIDVTGTDDEIIT